MELNGRKFPNSLKEFRRKFGYTQHYVARRLGHSDTSLLSKWEKGLILPSTENIIGLSIIFRTIPNELYPQLWMLIRARIAEKDPTLLNPRIPDWN